MTWQEWLDNNYEILEYWAKRWHWTDWGELLSLLSVYLQKNWSQFSKMPDDDERIKFIQTWYKNNVQWSNSEFNRNIRVNNFGDILPIREEGWAQDIEIEAESISEQMRQQILDWREDFSDEQIAKIIEIKAIKNKLQDHQKILYNLYFEKDLSTRKIAKLLNIPHSSVYNMLCDLKKTILELCG